MTDTIKRSIHFWGISYELQHNKKVFAKTRYTWGVLLRKIQFELDDNCYILFQRNIIFKLINFIPFFCYNSFPNYILKLNSITVGKTQFHLLKKYHQLNYNNNIYSFFLKKNNHVIVYKNANHIADIKKKDWSFCERKEYDVDVFREAERDIVLIIAVYSDIIFFSSHFNYSGVKFEKTI